ncbi:MAG: 1-acyl-sn-glycerol-3-phosphate acyltransferase [Desulfatiglans sp.]|jgi:1-acyl-sn-glycerol-3-phosphate acyltransferase|nr:1-acyl-sn-glycerol-3-phosphate acyltransferase [Desulfatiglans sp.]
MIRYLFIFIWTIISTITLSLVAICTAFFSRNGNGPHEIGRRWGKSILWVSGIRIQVKGIENLDLSKPSVFMCNHQSNFDIPVLFSALPAQFRWIAKAELFKIPLFGRAMRGAGYISIERKERRKAIQSLREAAEKIRSGVSVMIFPEGTRSLDGNIGEFKKGGFFLAYDAGAQIVPIVLNGTWSIMSKDSLAIRPGNVTLSILPSVNVTDYSKADKSRLIVDVRERIVKEFESNKALKEGNQ